MWIVAQQGARMHYAVPRIFNSAGLLEYFFTDFYSSKLLPISILRNNVQIKLLKRLLLRNTEDLSTKKVVSFNTLGLETFLRLRLASLSLQDTLNIFSKTDMKFGQLVANSNWGSANSVYTFNNASLEILLRAKQSGFKSVLEQTIAPKRVELRLLEEQIKRYPDWEEIKPKPKTSIYVNRQESEWQIADKIICGSQFVKDGIVECGGPSEKCIVVPYGVYSPKNKNFYSSNKFNYVLNENKSKLNVLTMGTIGIRKGAPIVYELAKSLNLNISFRWVGKCELNIDMKRKMSEYVELTGVIPRTETDYHYRWADLFFLPSICEGSATVVYEALSYGVPVICTPQTGSVIINGHDGYIFEADDLPSMRNCFLELLENKQLIERLSYNAEASFNNFTLDAYSKRLLNAVRN